MKKLLTALLFCTLLLSPFCLMAQNGDTDKKPKKEQAEKKDNTCRDDSCKKPEHKK